MLTATATVDCYLTVLYVLRRVNPINPLNVFSWMTLIHQLKLTIFLNFLNLESVMINVIVMMLHPLFSGSL